MSGDRFASTSGLPVCFWLDLTPGLCSERLPGREDHPPLANVLCCVPQRDKTPCVGAAGRNNHAEFTLDFRLKILVLTCLSFFFNWDRIHMPYNSPYTNVTNYTIQYFLVCSQSCATITTMNAEICLPPQKETRYPLSATIHLYPVPFSIPGQSLLYFPTSSIHIL